MNDIIEALKSMNTETLVVLVFAVVLLIFLLVLIIVTIRVLKANNDDDDDDRSKKSDLAEALAEDEEDEEEEMSEADAVLAAVEETRRKAEALEAANNLTNTMQEAPDMSASFAEEETTVLATEEAAEEEDDESDEYDDDYDETEEDEEESSEGTSGITDYEDDEDDDAEPVKFIQAPAEEQPVQPGLQPIPEAQQMQQQMMQQQMMQQPVQEQPVYQQPVQPAPMQQPMQPAQPGFAGPDPTLLGGAAPMQPMQQMPAPETLPEYQDPAYQQQAIQETPDSMNAPTAELNTDKIKEELRKVRNENMDRPEGMNEMAAERAQSPEYDASFDSAFVDRPATPEDKPEPVIPNPTPESMMRNDKITVNPVNEVRINTVNTVTPVAVANPEVGISGVDDVKDFIDHSEPAPKKKGLFGRKPKKTESSAPTIPAEVKISKYYWYNTQDIEGLTRKEDMYFKCHYFDEPDEAILDLITEMYDCAFVRTEQLQRIAYGITFHSLDMKDILHSDNNLSFDKTQAVKEPSAEDREEIRRKWCEYVDNFCKIIVIEAPPEVIQYIIGQMYEYGNRDVEELMYSPY